MMIKIAHWQKYVKFTISKYSAVVSLKGISL
jgi:hypothetical protein